MKTFSTNMRYFIRIVVILAMLIPLFLMMSQSSLAKAEPGYHREVRIIYTADYGLSAPYGLAFLTGTSEFFAFGLAGNEQTTAASSPVVGFTMYEDPIPALVLPTIIDEPWNTAYNARANGVFTLDTRSSNLKDLSSSDSLAPENGAALKPGFNPQEYQIDNAKGITFDPLTGDLYILAARNRQIVKISPNLQGGYEGGAGSGRGRLDRINIQGIGNVQPQGIAFNPTNGHLYVASPAERKIFELSLDGSLVSYLDLAEIPLFDIQSLLFAPSVDPTDDPAIMNLYITDSGAGAPAQIQGGKIVEVSLVEPLLIDPMMTSQAISLVQLIDTSLWYPNAPDPAGVDYDPFSDSLIVTDSEVEEMPPYWQGVNVFRSTRSGSYLNGFSTTAFSLEPTGITVNETNQHIFISDDNQDRVYEIDKGPDGFFGTSDDIRTYFSTREFNDMDPEDVAFGNGLLYVLDGDGSEVYTISPGQNGVFDGVTSGDDQVLGHFDTSVMGLSDVEGIDYNPDNGNLYLVGPNSRKRLVEATVSGALIQVVDITFINPVGPSDVSYAPSSYNPAIKSVYISMRGVDNGADPYENDGKIYELYLEGSGPFPTLTATNTATATATATNTATATATFTATATATEGPPPTLTNTPTPTNTSAPTDTPTPTNTLMPTDTPTNTPTPTDTPTPTNTPAPIHTPTATQTPLPTPGNEPVVFSVYLSLVNNGALTVGDLTDVGDEDILFFDALSNFFSQIFDGSDVGVGGTDLDAFHFLDSDTILMSFTSRRTLAGLGTAEASDIVRFDATSLGATTSGTFSMFLDGSSLGLSTSSENIDGIDVLPDGRLLVSTLGSFTVPGVSGADEDLLALTPSTPGNYSSGTWSLYFDGSDVGLSSNSGEDVNGFSVADNGDIYLSTLGNFEVAGVSGFNEDIFVCRPLSLGATTSCTFLPQKWVGASLGLSADGIDGLSLP